MSTPLSTSPQAPIGAPVTITLNESYFGRRNWFDWLFALVVIAGGIFAFLQYNHAMDGYEKGILIGTIPMLIWLGWFWRPAAVLMLVVAAFSLLSISLYDGDLKRADSVFLLKYFLSSQSAILWMCMLFFMSTLFYWIGMFTGGKGETDRYSSNALELLGSRMAWAGVALALIGTMVLCSGWLVIWMPRIRS